jgi:hypothetical protein
MNQTQIPENHPLRKLFRSLTDRALVQSSLPDRDLMVYLSNLLVDFAHIENVYGITDAEGLRLRYLVDMLKAAEEVPNGQRKRHYKQIGDYTLFILGMFPESLTYGRRALPHSYYADTGRRSYEVASALEADSQNTVVFRKLADKYERCVLSLNWVREYTHDPFYQFMLRQFSVS